MPKEKLWKLHKTYVKRTKPEAFVFNTKTRVTRVTKRTRNAINCRNRKIYITTRALKHLYDKKPAEEFDFILDHLRLIIRNPDSLYRNANRKEGRYCLTKQIEGDKYLAAIEVVASDAMQEELQIVTAFRIRDDKYLRNYDLLRSWRDGAHSS